MSRIGSENKNKVRPFDIAIKHGVDPFEVLINIIKGDYKALGYKEPTEIRYTAKGEPYEVERITLDHKKDAAKEACKYLYAQQKAVEHSASDGSVIASPVIMLNGVGTTSTEPKSKAE